MDPASRQQPRVSRHATLCRVTLVGRDRYFSQAFRAAVWAIFFSSLAARFSLRLLPGFFDCGDGFWFFVIGHPTRIAAGFSFSTELAQLGSRYVRLIASAHRSRRRWVIDMTVRLPGGLLFTISLKSLRHNSHRLIGTFIAIVLGVSFTSGVMMLSDTTSSALASIFRTEGAGVDVIVRVAPPATQAAGRGGAGGGGRDGIAVPTALVDRIATLNGVAGVEAIHQTRRGIVIVGKDEQPISNGFGAPLIAREYPTDPEMNPYVLSGASPAADTDVVLDAHTAELADIGIGETLTIRTPSKVGSFTLVGTVTLDQSLGGASGRALFTNNVAEGFNPVAGTASRIVVRAKPGVSQTTLRDRITPLLADTATATDIEAVTGADYVKELQARIGDLLAILRNGLLGFALLSLFVGAFIIYNTFSILVTQRQRELALLRAVGASKRQLVAAVLTEALCVGLVAGGAGVLGGALLAKGLFAGFSSFGVELPSGPLVIAGSVVGISVVTGAGMALACAWFPARRAAKIPPVAALRDSAVDASHHSRTRAILGIAITCLAGAVLASGLTQSGTTAAIRVGLATALTFAGITVLGPILAAPVARLVGSGLSTFGVTGQLARRNAYRNPRRTASTAAALMIGVAMVIFVLVMSATLRGIIIETTQRSITADLVVTADAEGRSALTVSSLDEVAATAGVKRVGGVTLLRATGIPGTNRAERIAAVTPTVFSQSPVTFNEGSVDSLGPTTVAISQQLATEQQVAVGTVMHLTFTDGVKADASVVAIIDDLSLVDSDVLVSEQFAQQHQPAVGPSQILVDRTDDVSTVALTRSLRAVPSLIGTQVQDISSFARSQASSLNTIVGVFLVMLGLSVIIAVFGIANTLSLSIFERTREIGLLRAVGATRRQIGSLVRLESVVLALLGTGEGTVIGLVFGIAIAHTLVTDPTAPPGLSVVVPWLQLGLVVVIAIAAGLFASLAAARRAQRLNVLSAIAVE